MYMNVDIEVDINEVWDDCDVREKRDFVKMNLDEIQKIVKDMGEEELTPFVRYYDSKLYKLIDDYKLSNPHLEKESLLKYIEDNL